MSHQTEQPRAPELENFIDLERIVRVGERDMNFHVQWGSDKPNRVLIWLGDYIVVFSESIETLALKYSSKNKTLRIGASMKLNRIERSQAEIIYRQLKLFLKMWKLIQETES